MHALNWIRALAAAVCVGVITSTSVAQTAGDDRYKVSLSIYGAAIEGSQERAARLVGKSPSERNTILNAPLPTFSAGQSFQLTVEVTDPTGNVTDYTNSAQLKYQHFGCLTVSQAGFVSVTPSGRCDGPNYPELWIVFTDSAGKPIVHNEYLFKVE